MSKQIVFSGWIPIASLGEARSNRRVTKHEARSPSSPLVSVKTDGIITTKTVTCIFPLRRLDFRRSLRFDSFSEQRLVIEPILCVFTFVLLLKEMTSEMLSQEKKRTVAFDVVDYSHGARTVTVW